MLEMSMRFNCLTILATALLVLSQLTMPAAQAKEFSIGTESTTQYVDAKAMSMPLPAIPPELHEHCFKSCCLARFQIEADGNAKVQLLSSSGLPELDDITLSVLKRWKFQPALLDGKPVPSTRKIKVEFQVE